MDFLDEQILQLKKQQSDPNYVAPNLPKIIPQDDNTFTDSGNWLEAAGIGASNMVNNLALGGFAQLLGTLGRGVEWISPFSGSKDNDRARLESWGVSPDIAREAYPDEDSWLTSGAKGLLEAQNFIGDKINQWRENAIGDNPSFGTQVAEGVGSSLGFMGAGLLGAAGGNTLTGAILSALAEAASESGGVLGDAYRQGKYDDGGLAAANKSLAANAVLNGALNTTLGMFSPWTKNIRNPLTRYAAQSGTEVLNEILQEPSQQTIEKAAQDSLHNGGNFAPALWLHAQDWPQDFSNLLPSVAASSLITSLVKGGIDMSSAQNRQQVRDEWRNRMFDPEQTAASLRAELDKRQKLLNQLQRTKALTPDNAKSIDDINNQIRDADKNIATYQDRLKPGNLDYTPNPYDEFSGRVSKVTTRAGQNEYNTAFMLAEADDLITSHNDTFSPNSNYNQDWQIRDRTNITSQNEVKRMADHLDPNALGDNYHAQNGAPIVFQNEDGKNYVISGNGRTLAIRQAYKYNNEGSKNYRKFIIDNASNFGVDPNIAASMKKPVLVRTLLDKNIDLTQFAADANSNTTQQLNATEKSLDYAKKINEKNLMRHFDPDKNISDNSDFLRELYKLTEPAERNNLTYTQGNEQTFSRQFVDDVANALRAVAFGNTKEHILVGKLNQATDDVSRNISNALNKLAPRFAVLNSSGHSDFNIAQELEDAVINLDRYRNNATKNITVEGQDRTLNMFDDLNLTPEARTILDFFIKYGNKPTEILQGLANYAKLASEQTEDGQGTIDGIATKSDKLTLLNRAFGNTSTRLLQQDTQQATPQQMTNAHVQQTAQQSNPAQNIQRTAAQTTQNTPNATAMNTKVQPQTKSQNQQDNINNPQGSRLVHNKQANSYDEEIQQSKSAPDYSESTNTGDLRLYPQQHNARGYTPFDTIGINGNQDRSDLDVPQYVDISYLSQNTDNEQTTQKPQSNSPNLSDNQGQGNLDRYIGNRSNDTNQIQQSLISSEQANEDNTQLRVPQYVDISGLIDTEQNNDENTQPYDNVNRSNFDHQYDSNSQQNLQTLSNNVQDNGNVQNQQERSKSDDYLPPEIIRTKEGNITVQGARVQRSFIPSQHEQIRNAARTGKPMTRYVFAKHGERNTSAPTANNPEKYSYDAKLSGYDGYLGDVTTGAGNYTDTAHAFYGIEDGVHYVGFADDNGNFVATYNMDNNSFFINEGSEHSGLARKIETEFKRQFGKNPTEEILRRLAVHKLIHAGVNDTIADAASHIYMEMNKYFASQSGVSLLDMVTADNLSIQKLNRNDQNSDRGSTKIIPEMGINGNTIFDAQTIISLFKKSDVSTVPHEFWHIYEDKIKRLANAGLIKKGSKLWQDWQTIRSEAGMLGVDFSQELSPKDKAKWLNSQEKNAAMFEQYLREGKAPDGISAKLRQVFNNFKEWLGNLYKKARDIFYTNANGKRISQPFVSEPMRQVFDHIFAGAKKFNVNQATEQAQTFSSYSDPQGFQEFRQSGLDPQGWFSQKWHNLKNWAGNLFSSAAKVGLPKSPTDWRSLPFPTQETQQRFMDAMKAAPKLGIIGRMRQTVRDIAASIKGGDYSDITNSTRKNDPQLRLNEALQAFRNLGRSKVAAADKAVTLMTDIIRPLNKKQRELLNTYTVIRDIAEQIDEMPGSPLSFGLSEQDARKMNAQLARMVDEDEKVKDAVKQLDDTRNAQVEEFKKQAHALGLNFDDVFHYKNYFRRRVFQYLEASRAGKHIPSARGNLDIQGRYDGELRKIMGHSFFMKRKGTQLDYVTDYVQANAEVRAQLAQDIETMKTLQIIKKNHDIASDLRKQHGLKSQQLEIDYDGSQSFSQSSDEHKSLLDVIPEGYEAFDPSATRLIETAQSAPENLMHMVANDIAEQHGFPVDDLLERLGIQNEGNIMVIPSEIANTLRKMAKARHRGMLGQAAKDLTTWWKRSVLFTPTRNLLYNIRNFTGDLDALIAGNPRALRHLGRSVKELTGWYTHHGKDGYEASQDLQDYIRLSGSLGIQSLNLSAKDAQAIVSLLDGMQSEKDTGKIKSLWNKGLKPIRALFNAEHSFTEWREHLLRFAAYLEYKNQMESNKDGRPSNWGASIEDEVMSIKDIKERAFKMSNELLGAYDQVSEVGKQLRDMLIPFYSWMEVNMRRTFRLLKNGFRQGRDYGFKQVQRYALGKAATIPVYAASAAFSLTRLAALTIAMQMFNRLWAPDADDDLPNDVKYRPHLTLGSRNGRTYYFDRIGAVADVLDWASLDSAWLDAKDFANGQKSIGSWLKQIAQAPFSKVINGLNPAIKMPIELAMGRSMFPNAFNPSTIRDPAEYVARSFGLAWPYKAARGIPHSNAQEASKILIYSQDSDEAAYWQTLDRVRQFQNEVLDKHFDGFASTRRGRILANIKKALRYNDRAAVRRFLKEYNEADGTKQGLKSSMNSINPLHSLNEKEKKQFMRWISADDRKYLRKAQRYFHQLADRFLR